MNTARMTNARINRILISIGAKTIRSAPFNGYLASAQ
jgi:hypothetical protein